MAKGRIGVGKHVSRWMSKDTEFYKAMYRCGSLTDRHLDALNIKPGRAKDHVADRYVTTDTDKKTGETTYRLTKVGLDKCAELGMNRAMNYQAQGTTQHRYHHDLKFADQYFKVYMDDKNKLDSWVNEREIGNLITGAIFNLKETDPAKYEEYSQMYADGKFSACDGGYWEVNQETGQEQLVLIEVVTSSYKASVVEAKMNTAMLLNAQYNPVFAR